MIPYSRSLQFYTGKHNNETVSEFPGTVFLQTEDLCPSLILTDWLSNILFHTQSPLTFKPVNLQVLICSSTHSIVNSTFFQGVFCVLYMCCFHHYQNVIMMEWWLLIYFRKWQNISFSTNFPMFCFKDKAWYYEI